MRGIKGFFYREQPKSQNKPKFTRNDQSDCHSDRLAVYQQRSRRYRAERNLVLEQKDSLSKKYQQLLHQKTTIEVRLQNIETQLRSTYQKFRRLQAQHLQAQNAFTCEREHMKLDFQEQYRRISDENQEVRKRVEGLALIFQIKPERGKNTISVLQEVESFAKDFKQAYLNLDSFQRIIINNRDLIMQNSQIFKELVALEKNISRRQKMLDKQEN